MRQRKASREAKVQYDPGPSPIVTVAILLGCIILLGIIFGALKVFVIDARSGTAQGIVQENGSIDLYFCPRDDCETVLLAALNHSSKESCAFYELNLANVTQALANATVLVFDENAKKVQGIAVHAVPSRGLMHDKFCVLDANTVVTGSMNPTTNDAHFNNNNLLIIHSPTLAARYTREFDELASRKDSSYVKSRPRPALLNLSGIIIEQRFCPQEECEAAVVREIAGARQEVAFMTFSFTSDPIGDAMIAASGRGAAVHGVFERRQIDEWSERERLRAAGIDARLDGNGRTMHHKVIILDNSTVITGSFNPTKSANERNDENLLIIHDHAIAMRYREEFEQVMAEAK